MYIKKNQDRNKLVLPDNAAMHGSLRNTTYSEPKIRAHNFLNAHHVCKQSTVMQGKLLFCDILSVLHRESCLVALSGKVPLMSGVWFYVS